MIIDVFDEPTVVDKLADGEDVAVLAALEGGPHAGVRQGWAAMQLDLDWDRQDPFGSAINALFLICDVLRGYESPSWGNTGGRYGHHAGMTGLTAEDWEALEAHTFALSGPTRQEYSDPETVQSLADFLNEDTANLTSVVQLGDMLDQITTRCRNLGRDY